jgi:hypothetical protein
LFRWKDAVVYVADSATLTKYGWLSCDVFLLYNLGKYRFDRNQLDIIQCKQIAAGPGVPRKTWRWLSKQLGQRMECTILKKSTWQMENRHLSLFRQE